MTPALSHSYTAQRNTAGTKSTRCTSSVREQRREQGHAHEEAVAGLAEVGGAWVGVDLRADLVDPGQRMQHDRVGAQARHQGAIDHVAAAGPPVRVEARKALLLHPRLVEHVD